MGDSNNTINIIAWGNLNIGQTFISISAVTYQRNIYFGLSSNNVELLSVSLNNINFDNPCTLYVNALNEDVAADVIYKILKLSPYLDSYTGINSIEDSRALIELNNKTKTIIQNYVRGCNDMAFIMQYI